jgi:hypothetical protein
MQPSGCPCYSSEGRSERRSLDPPLGGRPGDATTSVAGEKCAGATLHRARQWRRNFFRFNFIREVLAHNGLHCGIRHCFADSCLHEAYLPGCDLRDATAMPSPPCALFVCASACPARSRQAGIFIARICVDSARRSAPAQPFASARRRRRHAPRFERAKTRTRALLALCRSGSFWSGRRGSNPRPRPWQGRALPLSYTRIRDWRRSLAGNGRAMPNAASECNSQRETENPPARLAATAIWTVNWLQRARECGKRAQSGVIAAFGQFRRLQIPRPSAN